MLLRCASSLRAAPLGTLLVVLILPLLLRMLLGVAPVLPLLLLRVLLGTLGLPLLLLRVLLVALVLPLLLLGMLLRLRSPLLRLLLRALLRL
jgi:hypothetical protein